MKSVNDGQAEQLKDGLVKDIRKIHWKLERLQKIDKDMFARAKDLLNGLTVWVRLIDDQ